MRFRLGFVTGIAMGYYLGAKAGRQRYDQINRTVAKLRRSEVVQSVVEEATEKARAAVEEGVEKARSVMDRRDTNGHSNGHGDVSETEAGIILPGPGSDPGLGGYSSSR